MRKLYNYITGILCDGGDWLAFLDDMGEWKPKRWFGVVLKILGIGFAFVSVGWLLGLINVGGSASGEGTSFGNFGPVGDYFGGMMAPFIGLIGAFLTFAAFYVQYQSNVAQIARLDKQEKDLLIQQQKDRFEQRFFEMLKIHRENSNAFEIVQQLGSQAHNSQGKRAFQIAAREVELTMELLSQMQKHLPFLYEKSAEDLLGISYLFVYWGVDDSVVDTESTKRFSFHDPVAANFLDDLNKLKWILRDNYMVSPHKDLHSDLVKYNIDKSKLEKFRFPFSHELWRGQHFYWSQYIRQLLRIFEMLDEALKIKILKSEESSQYARILRSQLSNDEQKLIYYYSLSNIGNVLWVKSYITNYIPFKNINIGEIPSQVNPKETIRGHLKTNGLPSEDRDLLQYFDYLTDYY